MLRFNLFFLYSVLGWLLEVFWARLIGQKKRDRKCRLLLPLCPIYGFAAVALFSMPPFLTERPPALFVAGGLVATLVEYAAALVYEWGAGVRFWDYSNQPGNLSGRICPLYTLLWGLLAMVTVYGLGPALAPLTEAVPPRVSLALFAFTGADSLVTLCLLRATGETDSLSWYRAFLPARTGREGSG